MQQSAAFTSDQQSIILEILGWFFKVDNDFLIRLASETYIYLLATKIVDSPK